MPRVAVRAWYQKGMRLMCRTLSSHSPHGLLDGDENTRKLGVQPAAACLIYFDQEHFTQIQEMGDMAATG